MPFGVDVARYKNRLQLIDELESAASAGSPSPETAEHRKLYERAAKMILSPDMKAFDLAKEPDKIRDAYGRENFGAGCLLARRLIESGVTFVEVVLDGWDTHQDNFDRTKKLAERVRWAIRHAGERFETARHARQDSCHLDGRIRPHAENQPQ